MEKSILFKKIKDSVSYGLSNKKSGTWGIILDLYTYIWVVWTFLVILVGMLEASIFDLIFFIIFLILPPYIPIYYVWSRDTINAEKQNGNTEKIQKEKELINMENDGSNNFQNIPKFSNLTQNRIKGIDRILHGEKIIDGISGTINKGLFGTNADVKGSVVLTPTRVVFYSKKILGRYHYRDYQISNISNVTFSSGLLFNDIILHTNNTDIKVRNIPKKDLSEKFVDNVKSCIVSSANYQSIRGDDIDSNLSISRETEFYQGYIRFKMSVTNTSSFVVNDVALDFDFDDELLRMDRHEPSFQIKNGKIVLGNISGDLSKTVAVYFDPLMCSKGTDINCQINYKDAKGHIQTTRMEPKQISVVCPIMKTESDINIGRLKEFIEKLPHHDSKVYQIQTGFAIDKLKNSCRQVMQKHDVKHIRTLSTIDGKTCELWYYGKTKVNSHDIVIKITISGETQSIELFAATQSAESLAGLLAEVGRELKSAVGDRITGNVQQVINLSIIDSIVQRSNLLSYCDIDGNCSGDVVIEDSLVQRSDIGPNNKDIEKEVQKMELSIVYEHLIDVAKKGCKRYDTGLDLHDKKERKKLREQEIIVTYGDVLKRFGEKPDNRKAQDELFKILDKINEKTEPTLLSALVVREKDFLPGEPFFLKWLPWTKDEDELSDWVKELEKIWQHY